MKIYISSQLSYCSFLWMSHKRDLRIIYEDKPLSFKKLLEKDKSTSAHVKNLQALATKIYKISKNMFLQLLTSFLHKGLSFTKYVIQ